MDCLFGGNIVISSLTGVGKKLLNPLLKQSISSAKIYNRCLMRYGRGGRKPVVRRCAMPGLIFRLLQKPQTGWTLTIDFHHSRSSCSKKSCSAMGYSHTNVRTSVVCLRSSSMQMMSQQSHPALCAGNGAVYSVFLSSTSLLSPDFFPGAFHCPRDLSLTALEEAAKNLGVRG